MATIEMHGDDSLDAQSQKAVELVDEIATALGPRKSEKFLMQNADKVDRLGVANPEYWQFVYEQYINHVLHIKGDSVPAPHFFGHTGSTRKRGSHTSQS